LGHIKGIKAYKPQINADERRYAPASEFSKIIHRKERKVMQQESLCPGMKESATDTLSCSFKNQGFIADSVLSVVESFFHSGA